MSDTEERKLTPANENPWYCLATLYGEWNEEEDDLAAAIAIHTKNRQAWNRWYASVLTDEKRSLLIEKGFPAEDLEPLTDTEQSDLSIAFATRSGQANRISLFPMELINFGDTHFDTHVNLSHFLFANTADFTSAKFSGNADFTSATFSGNADFTSATFSGNADFTSATFSSWASFASATFAGKANFTSATFPGGASFASAKFSDWAAFTLAKFSGWATFTSATFSSGASFASATFSGQANFTSATFSGNAAFTSATFAGWANFTSASFSGQAFFTSATFSGQAFFTSATFSSNSIFLNTEFKANTNFDKARFNAHVPDYRGAKLHEATEWHDAHWPVAPLQKKDAHEQVEAYGRLKQEMERLKKHEDEQFFFRKELRARRGTMPFFSWDRLLNFTYEGLSEYGQSTLRPFRWLLGLFAFGTLLLAETPTTPAATTVIGLQRAASLNYAYIFSIFPFHSAITADQKFSNLSGLGQTIFLVETLFGTLLLFLIGLALRNKFRMK